MIIKPSIIEELITLHATVKDEANKLRIQRIAERLLHLKFEGATYEIWLSTLDTDSFTFEFDTAAKPDSDFLNLG
jgi:hypothetical protein